MDGIVDMKTPEVMNGSGDATTMGMTSPPIVYQRSRDCRINRP